MFKIALKNLRQDLTRMILCIGGVAAAVLLILAINGVFAGVAKQLTIYIDESKADVLISQSGVKNMHMASSVVPLEFVGKIEKVPGVKKVVPIAYYSGMMKVPGQEGSKLVYIIGVDETSGIGGPWKMATGKSRPEQGEIVISQGFASSKRLKLGDRVQLIDSLFTIKGISLETDSMASTFVFISLKDASSLRSQQGAANYFLVTAVNLGESEVLAGLIEKRVPEVNVSSRQTFSESDREIAIQMGMDIIRAMSVVALVIGLMIIFMTLYTATLEKSREYGILKAIGADNRYLLKVILLQAAISTVIGLLIGIAMSWGINKLVPIYVPDVVLLLEPAAIIQTSLSVMVAALVAALLPILHITRVDPMMVFKS
ncbi:MAG: FtsX-like permease family protein [Ruminiclostridium sp.]|nr:FtsX-like permease family protein [Ruminiclostridium sp.]